MSKAISDDFMKEMLTKSRGYTVVILKSAPNRTQIEGADRIVWEHARNNFRLREEGLLSIVCPVIDGSDISGVGIFNASVEEVRALMDADPGVQAGLFTYEVHPCRSFPGDSLPQ